MFDQILKMMRIKHYIKNSLILAPLFFNKSIFRWESLSPALVGVVCFSLLSSAVYIFNDLRDMEKDRNHPIKRERPIASGRVSKSTAIGVMVLCLGLTGAIALWLDGNSWWYLAAYLLCNVGYSLGLKRIPVVDVAILSAGFVLRVLYGGALTGIPVSNWLFLVVLSTAMYMGLGKRRNELRKKTDSRDVLNLYSEEFLNGSMSVFLTLLIVFYSLWTVEYSNTRLIYTVPLVIIILLKYSYDVDGESDGDPVEVLLHDRGLLTLSLGYMLLTFWQLYA